MTMTSYWLKNNLLLKYHHKWTSQQDLGISDSYFGDPWHTSNSFVWDRKKKNIKWETKRTGEVLLYNFKSGDVGDIYRH